MTRHDPGPSRLFRQAVERHRSGRLDEAEAIYRRLLAADPDDAEAHHMLGLVAAQTGRIDEAERHLEAAIARRPDHPEAHNNLGNLRQLQGRLEEAVAAHERAVAIRPDNVKAHFNLAVALTRSGRPEEAERSYRRCLELDPAMGEAHHNLAKLLRSRQRLDEAEACLMRLLELRPKDAEVHESLGALMRDAGRLADAARWFERAMRLDPKRAHLRHLVAAYTGRTTDAAPADYVEHLYDNLAESFDDWLVHVLDYRTPQALRAMLFDVLDDDHRFRRALDLGCGTGLAGVEIAPAADELWGIDLSRRMLDVARGRGIYQRLEVSDIEAFLERTDATFDLFVAADVFVHIGNLARVFELVSRRAEEGALFLFSTEISDAGDFALNPTGRYAHARRYIEALAGGSRFTILKCDRHPLRTERDAFVIGNCYLLQAG